ncbi:5-(carboxyamino)imidazole ribonucleotide mutase [uncultured Methanobrevibacter sp.]|uniref:5-(carboxyamino)imidazole ribonucleotide mutase n=1 Tax=uncultured Methanobrevibacter sp. TaxID=253161 RepID=UPI0025D55ABB|nr:5-(carboxyamino)imidazole ribonucleotide mutase [uncultured Methanobrevibacter sp.]
MVPKVMIILGSSSDIAIAEKSMDIFEKLEIPYSLKIASAHRTPDLVRGIVKQGTDAGIEVFIGIAGLAAHLPGAIAAYTPRPVIGVPVDVKTGGIDALDSCVQMPYPSPIATVGIDRGDNGAILAAQFMALNDEEIREKVIKLRKEYEKKVFDSNKIVDTLEDKKYLVKDYLDVENLKIEKEELDIEDSINPDAEVAILVGRQSDLVVAKKVSATLDRLKITYNMKVICPIRSNRKFKSYVASVKNSKVFIGISANSSQVTGALVGLTDRPVIGVPCENELRREHILTTVNMPPGVPVATVGINNGRNAGVLVGEILSIKDTNTIEILTKLKDKKINL